MATFDCNNTSLRQGSTGEKVKTLQTYLKQWGYYSGAIDSSYGTYTRNAVRSFQSAYKLSVDGYFGPQTCKKFNQVVESKNQTSTTSNATNTNTSSSTSTSTASNTTLQLDCSKTDLKKGSKGELVTKLQTMLKELKYYTRQIDGDYGEYTKQAVIAYQNANGHDPDGWFGPKTCKTLNSKFKTATSTSTVNPAKQADTTPEHLRKLSAKLVVHPTVVVLPETEIDSTTNTKTVTAGAINTDTNFNCDTINLSKGSSGDNVKKLQTILKARGYYTRQIDGDYGSYTVSAVKKLQSAQGNDPDGWFGPKTCRKLQGISTTSNTATGTGEKKQTDYVITDFKSYSSNDDIEGLSHEVSLTTPYSEDKINHLRKLQKTKFTLYLGTDLVYEHEGYINDLKITNEDDGMMLELNLVGYTAFLDMQVEYEKTAKRSVLLKELTEMAGLKLNLDLTGLTDDEYTVKAQKAAATTSEGGGGNLVQASGNDCEGGEGRIGAPKYHTNKLSSYSYDIDKCSGNVTIGNSSANYAKDTANMSGKEAILDARTRFKYGPSMSSTAAYPDNVRCPQTMWTKTGKFYGNCADISRLIKCIGDVHGVKVGIHHMYGHYYNLIEVNGKTYRFDCCFKDDGEYNGEITNNLTMRGGPWSK